jgi:hypothetical protein
MFGHLLTEALVGAPFGGEFREANEKAAQESHGSSSAWTSKKRAIGARPLNTYNNFILK